ncbi:MAG: Zn-dependent hydrolase [Blastocatellales bacterium]
MMNRRDFSLNLLAAAIPVAWQGPAGMRINGERVNRHLAELSQFGRNEQGGVSRVAYSEADLAGREYAMKLMRGADLDVRIDAAGNLVGRRAGRDSSLPPLVIGSHIDSVPEGGNYDGEVGSMGAIEVAQTLAENRVTLRHPLEVIIFQNEEGGTIGSHAIAYGLTEKTLGLVTNSRKTIRDGIRYIGGDPSRLSEAVRKPGSIAAYLELHIEQGGILHAEKTDIGVVEGIVGINWWDVTIEGFANHAGTTPMNQRRDAMLAAARYVDAVNRVATSIEGRQVATVGRMQPFPGAYNVIPGKVVTSLEIRDLDPAKMNLVYQKILPEVSKIEQATGTKFTFTQTMQTPPAPTDPKIRRVIDDAAKGLGYSTRSMPSGAGHDAQEMAHLGPVGMIFVPSVDGISHSPREFSSPEAIAKGVNVLLQAVLKLD